jgi:uncharacterized protein YndB with AHSA1/START domain
MSQSIVIQVRHLFSQLPAAVFDHWLAEHRAGRWLFATPRGRMQNVQLQQLQDLKFLVTEQLDNQCWVHTGQYHQVQRPQLLLFTFSTNHSVPASAEPDLVQLRFAPHPLGCELELSHQTSAHWAPFQQQLIEGWTHIFAALTAELNNRAGHKDPVLN